MTTVPQSASKIDPSVRKACPAGVRKRLLPLLALPFLSASARTWTDTKGRTIEAEFLRADDSTVTLLFKDKETALPLTRLCDDDRQWIEEHQGGADAKPVDVTLCGTRIEPGGPEVIVEPALTEETLKAFRRSDAMPSKLKLAVRLPAGFNPAKPQRVLWVSAAINNDGERKAGNCGSMGMYADTAVAAGWVVVAADTDLGNPRGEDNVKESGADEAVQRQAVDTLAGAWPGFSAWEFACCGHSGGAKATFYRVAQLLAADLDVKGAFLSGCNQDMTKSAREEVRFSKSRLRKVRAFISNGKNDQISTIDHAENLERSIDPNFGEVQLHLFNGGHSVNQDHVKEALAWFVTR